MASLSTSSPQRTNDHTVSARLTDSFLTSRNQHPDGGEDRIIHNGRFIGVCDGATDKIGIVFHRENNSQKSFTGGALIADLIVEAFQCGLIPDSFAFRDHVAKSLTLAAKVSGIDLSRPENRPEAAFAVVDTETRKLYLCGDCLITLVKHDGTRVSIDRSKAIDKLTASIRTKVLREESKKLDGGYATLARLISTGEMKDIGREAILPLLKRQYLLNGAHWKTGEIFAEVEGHAYTYAELAYNFFNGFNENAVTVQELEGDVNQVILATDGVPSIDLGLNDTLANLFASLENDPLSAGLSLNSSQKVWARTKGRSGCRYPDDIAFVSVKL